ncbi:autotransporter outer membrane beta-barrel domain-containing protein [Duffyella gerundensis]|nr:autotransporter outer membrane beta-barrel domain-containing protein [Duffyella gerundensis]
MIIEGGASGIIDQATRIDLSGRNAIGALADGQKHTLAGSNSGSPSAATSLNSAAELDSAQEGIVGYIARNRASLTNTGNIAFTGADTTGLRVESGASGTNSGNITIADGGSGIIVDSNGSALTTTATNTGVINVNGGSSAARSRGVTASGARAVANLNGGSFNLNGVGALGAEAINGGRVNVSAASTPQFNNRDQIAYRAAGRGSAIDSASNALSITTAGSTGYRIDDGAALRYASAAPIR